MNFGEITLGGKLGGYTILNQPADKLPQEVASAIPAVAADCTPIWYYGTQVVNGMNHAVVCQRKSGQIVYVVINIPPNSVGGKGAKLVSITDSADLYGVLKEYFDIAIEGRTGVGYKPVAFFGEKVVKGINYYILCQSTIMYPGSKPYAAVLEINVFENKATLVGVERLGGLGYAFTW